VTGGQLHVHMTPMPAPPACCHAPLHSPYNDFNAIQDILITLVFCVDILLHTRLAYQVRLGAGTGACRQALH
jgi:hypothetical protein